MQQFLLSVGYTCLLALPIQTRSSDIGAVICGHYSEQRPWSDSEVELLQAVVSQLAIAIDQADLYAQAQKAALVAQTQADQMEQTLHQLQTTQAQLIQSEKMSALGQLVAGVAHEINNPVSFITGNLTYATQYIQDLLDFLSLYQQHYPQPVTAIQERAEAIELEFLLDDLPKLVTSMQMGADRIGQIVLSLRNFSRIDEAEMKQVNLHEDIDNTLLILQHRLKPNGRSAEIQIVKDYGDLPLVECYPGQLNQVFMNILSNAIDALEEKRVMTIDSSPVITICTKVLPPGYVTVCIADNGPGITEAVKARLFDPFFTTKPIGTGTGLGLSISYQIVVEKHKGVLKCLSEPGCGAEFWIEIPMAAG
jgi:signal transduction histidine kinase